MVSNMTLRHLKIFVAVNDCGGVTKAAEALHIAQPAVSTTISELEKYYEVVLFDRINQRLVITEMGKRLLLKAREVIAGFDDFETLAIEGGNDPTIRIGCSLTLGKTFLPDYIGSLKKQIPLIEPTVVINKTSFIEKELEKGNLDFGFVEGETESPYLTSIRFGGDNIVAACSRDFNVPESLGFAELIKYPLLLRQEGSASREMFEKALSFYGLSAKPMIESASNQCLICAAESGIGIAILPEGLVSERVRAGAMKQITVEKVDFSRTHYLLIHKNKRLNPIGKQAYDWAFKVKE